jgi:hypothetical protein
MTRLLPALLLAPALVGLALGACRHPSDPLVPYLGPATVCGRGADLEACDGGWAYQCAPDPGGGCAWRTQGAPCRDEPEARGVVVAGGRCGPRLRAGRAQLRT